MHAYLLEVEDFLAATELFVIVRIVELVHVFDLCSIRLLIVLGDGLGLVLLGLFTCIERTGVDSAMKCLLVSAQE